MRLKASCPPRLTRGDPVLPRLRRQIHPGRSLWRPGRPGGVFGQHPLRPRV